jgi:RNA recognition motif-containing protein
MKNNMEVDPSIAQGDTTTSSTSQTQPPQDTVISSGFASDSDEDQGWSVYQSQRKGKNKVLGEQPKNTPLDIQRTTNQEKRPRQSLPPPVDWAQEYGRHRYKMQTPLNSLPGQNDSAKINNLKQALARLESFTTVRTTTQDNQKMAVALFVSEKDAARAQQVTLSDGQSVTMEAIPIFDPISAKSKMIRAWDIPLNTTKPEISAVFAKYGEIRNISMKTIGMWQTAIIEFTNHEDFEKVSLLWSVPLKADLIRIFPFLNTNQIREERAQHTLKLNNLPPGTRGYDLKEIIKETNAKTCYIPRMNNYNRKRFAILSFETVEHLEAAKDTHPELGNTQLSWHNMEEKLCAICNKSDHIAKNCETRIKREHRIQEKTNNLKKFQHLYKRYKPSDTAVQKFLQNTQRFKNKPFSQAVKQEPTVKAKRNIHKASSTNPVAHINVQNLNTPLATILSAIHQLGEEIKNIATALTALDQRIGNIEEDAYWFHSEEKADSYWSNTEEKTDAPEITTLSDTQDRSQTPNRQLEPPSESSFNYQRKRQANSPAMEIREEQRQLYQRFESMDNTLNNVASALNELTDTILEGDQTSEQT